MTTLLSKIKNYYFKKQLKEQLNLRNFTKRPYAQVKTVGILFDASSQENREVVAQQAEILRNKGKKVRILSFFNDKIPHEGLPYPYFNQKDIDWRFIPKKGTEAISDFVKQPFDILFTYALGENKTLDYITAISQSNFKASRYTGEHYEAQLMIDVPATSDLKFLVRQIDFYLEKINQKNEIAVAV